MSRLIVAFAGSKGSGKTTAFNAVKDKFSNVYEFTLAGHLKTACGEVFSLSDRQLYHPEEKEQYLEDPVMLDAQDLELIYKKFDLDNEIIYDKHVRPFLGKILETPRKLLQFIGTDVLHKINPLIHAEYAAKTMPDSGLIIVTDLRFEKEFNYFNEKHSNEFKPFYIDNKRAELMAMGDTHPSEKDLLKFKHKCTSIDNNSTQSEYEVRVQDIINTLKV